MRISIFGLGYVGAVSAGCLAHAGHQVIGVDTQETKLRLINAGQAPLVEQSLGELIDEAVRAGRLRATANAEQAVHETDMSLICVGTPSQLNGSLDLSYVRKVCEQIGAALRHKPDWHLVVVRSTMLPGSMRGTVIPALESTSGGTAGRDFGVCINPEFLREGTAVHDFHHPPKTVIGEFDRRSGDRLLELYRDIDAPLVRTDIETSELVKYADNVWHALKVCFANEIGSISKALGLDGHRVMDIFCQDTKLNLSPYYLKPGFAFGGSCLPKDVRALTYKAKSLDVEVPVLNAIMPSNALQVERALKMVQAKGGKRVGVLGFSFKAGTDDLRESPVVELIERLLGKGYELKLYDRNVNLAGLVGANRDYILNQIPHISKLMARGMDEVLAHADTIVIGNGDPEFAVAAETMRDGQVVVDLVRITDTLRDARTYDGIAW